MNTEQFIIILAGVSAIIVFVLSHMKVSKVFKALLFILFPAIIICSTILQVSYLKKKETKEAAQEIKIDQIDTHIKASLTFQDYIESARLNRQMTRIDDAIYDVVIALKKEPKSATALNLLGLLYFDKGDFDTAIQIFGKIEEGLRDSSIPINNDFWLYHKNFGETFIKKSMWKEAKEEFIKSLTLNESNLGCYLELAQCLDMLSEWQQLYNICMKGTAKYPSSPYLYNYMGKVGIVTSHFEDGEKALLIAVEVDSTFGQPYLWLAVIYHLRKENEKSAIFRDKAFKLDPTLSESIQILKDKNLLE